MTHAADAATLHRKSAGSAFWVMLEGGVAQFLALIAFAIIARFIDPHAYGLVAVSLALLEMIRAVLVDVLATVLTSDRMARLRDWHGAYWLTLAWCLTLTLLAVACAPVLASAFGMPDLAPVLQLLSLNILFYGVGRIPEGYLTQAMRFRPLALRTLISVLVGGVCGVAAAIAGWGVYALILQQLIMPAVSSACTLWLARWRPTLRISLPRLRRHLNHAATLTPSALAYVVSQNLDVLVVSATLGATVSGLYNLARRLRLAAQMVFLGLGRVALATFTSLEGSPDRIGPSFIRGAQFIAIIAAPVFVGMALVGEELITLVFGAQWSAAAPILGILMLAGPVLVFNDYLEQLLVSRRRLSQLALTKVFYIGVLAILLFTAARFGWVGVAWASTLSAALLTPVMLRIATRSTQIDMKALGRALLGPALACAAMTAAILLLRPVLGAQSHALRMAIMIPVGAASYAICLVFVSRNAVTTIANIALEKFAPNRAPLSAATSGQRPSLLSRLSVHMRRRFHGPARTAFHFVRRHVLSPLLPPAPKRAFPLGAEAAVCGLLASTSGLGKSARLCLTELRRLNCAAHSDDVSRDYGLDEGMSDPSFKPAPSGFSGIKIWHLNPPMLLPTILRHAPHRFFQTYNIAYWAWEFDVIPQDWIDTARMMDAVLVTSTFVADALRRRIQTPVIVVHHPVEIPEVTTNWRPRLGLEGSDFVVHLSYNYGSSFERKNPLAAVEAFLRAFPDERNAKLVIKTAQSAAHQSDHARVLALAADSPRVIIVDEILDEHDALSLISSSDALISLHRSEGFGLPMAEAMYLGVPVVATAWSGNVDFCTDATSLLVHTTLVPVQVNHAHIDGLKNARWAEPDAGHAAVQLRQLYADPALRHSLAAAAGAKIRELREQYSYARAFEQLVRKTAEQSGD